MDFRKVTFHPLANEAVKFLIAIAWGLTLLIPGNTFGNAKGYSIMAKIAPEEIWGLFPVLFSVVYFATIKSQTMRKILTFTMMIFWLVVAISIFSANNLSTATASYIGYAVLSAFSFLRVGRE